MYYCTCDNPEKEHRYGNGPIRCKNCRGVWNPAFDKTTEEKLLDKIDVLEKQVEHLMQLCRDNGVTFIED